MAVFEHPVVLPDGTVHTVTSGHWFPPMLVTVDGVRYFKEPTFSVEGARRRPHVYLPLANDETAPRPSEVED